jgi:hypothetical protein
MFRLIEITRAKSRSGRLTYTYEETDTGQCYEFHGSQPTEAELAAAHAEFNNPDSQIAVAAIRAYLSTATKTSSVWPSERVGLPRFSSVRP